MRTSLSTAFITHTDCLLHDMGAGHPESPARMRAIGDQLIASGLINFLIHAEAPLAKREHLERVHDARYLDAIECAARNAAFSVCGFIAVSGSRWIRPELGAAHSIASR